MSTHRTYSLSPAFFLTLNFAFSQIFSDHLLWKDSSTGKESACNAEDLGLIPGSGRSPGEVIGYALQYFWASLVAQMVKNLPAIWGTLVWSLCWEDPLEEGMATHSSILAWRIPMGKRSLAATVHEVAKSSDMTEWLSTAEHTWKDTLIIRVHISVAGVRPYISTTLFCTLSLFIMSWLMTLVREAYVSEFVWKDRELVMQLCTALCNPMDWSPPGFSVSIIF